MNNTENNFDTEKNNNLNSDFHGSDKKITIDDFKKVEITVGEIKSVEKVVGADRLLRLIVNFGDHERQIVSGIAEYYPEPSELIGKKCPFVTNLEPRTIKGLESNGMIMAAVNRASSTDSHDESDNNSTKFSLLNISDEISPGTKIS